MCMVFWGMVILLKQKHWALFWCMAWVKHQDWAALFDGVFRRPEGLGWDFYSAAGWHTGGSLPFDRDTVQLPDRHRATGTIRSGREARKGTWRQKRTSLRTVIFLFVCLFECVCVDCITYLEVLYPRPLPLQAWLQAGMQLNRPRSALIGFSSPPPQPPPSNPHPTFSSQFKAMRFSYHLSPQPGSRRTGECPGAMLGSCSCA